MKRALSIRKNRDGTATIRATAPGRCYVEHIGVEGKTPYEAYDTIRWAVITAGFSVEEHDLAEMVRAALYVEGD